MKIHSFTRFILSLSLLASSCITSADDIEEVIVTADFYQTPLLQVNGSVSVFNAEQIQQRSADHLEQLFNLAPNVNYASGASRGRYIQIRGIGERSQFIDPVNPSVGVLIDGIDFTGISTAASLLDVAQVEILRGPQGTLYGANALAGLVNITTNEASAERNGVAELNIADYGTHKLSVATGGALTDNLNYRIAAQNTASDGYIENTYLGRDNTNNIDESTLRVKLGWKVNDILTLDFTGLVADIDNGYDAFSLDNTRQTLSDQPGTDSQQTNAAAIKASWSLTDSIDLIASAGYADSELEYGYDEDWAYPGLCTDFSCTYGSTDGYSWYDNYIRNNKNNTIDIRAVSKNADSGAKWIAGFYLRDQQVDLNRIHSKTSDGVIDVFSSQYSTENLALYGQIDLPLTDRLKVIAGLRLENFQADYSDTEDFYATPEENLSGGKLGLEYQLDKSRMIYGLVSRGYKAGGFNANNEVPEDRREFKAETLWNYEAGIKGRFLEGKLQASVSVFYQDRKDIQAKQYFAIQDLSISSGTSFVDFIDNAASGSNTGMETELILKVNNELSLFTSLGLLRTKFDRFSYYDADGNETVKDGRDQAHAPHYQYALGADYQFKADWMLHIELEGKDEFYFSDSHDQKSEPYNLLNARLNYSLNDWDLALWVRNLTDEEYQVRGFEFPNDPRDGWATNSYTQLGEPRVVGVNAKYYF